MAACASPKESSTPPPIIGKMGRYTVFITPPCTPKPSQNPSSPSTSPHSPSPSFSPSPNPSSPIPTLSSLQTPTSDPPKISSFQQTPSDFPKFASPKISSLQKNPSDSPKVAPPPQQFNKKPSATPSPNSSLFGFFWNTVARVQEVHSSVDEYLADWFGLNQSKYQWALNDYYESKEKQVAKSKENGNKVFGA